MSDGRFAFRVNAPLGLEGPEAATLWEFGCRAVSEEDGTVVGYFDRRVELPLEGEWQERADVDYLQRYYDELQAVTVGNLVVAPSHREVILGFGQKVLWLDPGMAFGSGHHETTHMALAALGRRELYGLTVLDVGAGSGILAIAADLLGAERAYGIDIDESTVEVARSNARSNRSRASFFAGPLDPDRHRADLIVANLFAELHAFLAADYARVLSEGSELLVTGILADRAQLVSDGLAPYFDVTGRYEDGEWVLFEARRNSRPVPESPGDGREAPLEHEHVPSGEGRKGSSGGQQQDDEQEKLSRRWDS